MVMNEQDKAAFEAWWRDHIGLPVAHVDVWSAALAYAELKSRNVEPVAYANRDELDNMLDDRIAEVAGVRDGWRTTALYTHPQPIPEGWKLEDCGDGWIKVQKPGLGGYAAHADAGNIASSILHALAKDLLAAAPEAPK